MSAGLDLRSDPDSLQHTGQGMCQRQVGVCGVCENIQKNIDLAKGNITCSQIQNQDKKRHIPTCITRCKRIGVIQVKTSLTSLNPPLSHLLAGLLIIFILLLSLNPPGEEEGGTIMR